MNLLQGQEYEPYVQYTQNTNQGACMCKER